MNNTKLFLLIGTSLSLIPHLTSAQCVATQDCATLGYTETSCSGGSGVKCPFGNKWACFKTDAEFCNEYGFSLACSGNGYAGGTSKACNGKYVSCNCASGYAWNASSKKCEYDYKTNCTIGALYYSDGTCSDKLETSKTLLGVVIYEKTDKEDGWIMTTKKISSGYWDNDYLTMDSTGVRNKEASASCTNTEELVSMGKRYAAANDAYNYSPAGTPSNKKWCLPSYGVLANMTNEENLAKINVGIVVAKGTKIGFADGGGSSAILEYITSSSEDSTKQVWKLYARIDNSAIMTTDDKIFSYSSVRPVMAF